MISARSRGIPGATDPTDGAGRVMCCASKACTVGALKGNVPVSAWNATTPSE